ncbi:hypothetical protein [Xanthovirga aplysinae]|uniref:hypothetical protein n=1 Tax=Xanthovirga aplysinae TaxID=2529853 RepID=UPI0012BCD763|nr:hypothetical protein [Xanthovirga aplysinae]MTI32502.1 hypothetical protein [Xanthovirga aplysinae]
MKSFDDEAIQKLVEEHLKETSVPQNKSEGLDSREKELYFNLFTSLDEAPNLSLSEDFSNQVLIKIERKNAIKQFAFKVLFLISLLLVASFCWAMLYLYQINLPQSLLHLITFLQKPLIYAGFLWGIVEISDILFVKRHTYTHLK